MNKSGSYSPKAVAQLLFAFGMRSIRWDMTVLRESPWYEQILQEGEQKGIQEGLQQGIQQGLQEGIQQVALNMLSKGMSAEEISDLTGLTVEQVQHLSAATNR